MMMYTCVSISRIGRLPRILRPCRYPTCTGGGGTLCRNGGAGYLRSLFLVCCVQSKEFGLSCKSQSALHRVVLQASAYQQGVLGLIRHQPKYLCISSDRRPSAVQQVSDTLRDVDFFEETADVGIEPSNGLACTLLSALAASHIYKNSDA